MFILDSCICIELMRGKLPRTFEFMRGLPASAFKIPYIVEAELLTGAEKSGNPVSMRMKTLQFLAPFERLALDDESAQAYAETRALLEKKGCKIGPNDLIIASIALAHGATIVTRNVREFSRVPHLKVEDWEEIEL